MPLLDDNPVLPPDQEPKSGFDMKATDVQPYGYLDLFFAAGQAAARETDPAEQWDKKLSVMGENISAYEKATGRDFEEDMRQFTKDSPYGNIAAGVDFYQSALRGDSGDYTQGFSGDKKERYKIFEDFFNQKSQDPNLAGLFKNNDQIEEIIRQKELSYDEKLQEIREVVGGGVLADLTEFAAGTFEQLKDPENVITLFIPAGRVGGVIKKALTVAAENVAIEMTQFPRVSDYHQDVLKREYGLDRFLIRAGTAGAFGALAGGAARGLEIRQEKKLLAEFFDDVYATTKKSGDELTPFLAANEAQRVRMRDFDVESVGIRGADDPRRLIVEGGNNLNLITRQDISQMNIDDIAIMDTTKIEDPGLRTEIEEFQKIAGLKEEVAPEVEPSAEKAINEFEAVETGKANAVTIEEAQELAQKRAELASKRKAKERVSADLDALNDDLDPDLKRVADALDLDVAKIKSELESLSRLEKAISVCGGAR